jgi:N-glycosylase/DNA lyase
LYKIEGGNIRIKRGEPFDARKIAESGQMFRYNINDGAVDFYAADVMCRVTEDSGGVTIQTTARDAAFFVRYFDLDASYSAINAALREKGIAGLNEAIAFSGGIRMLHQDKFEALISFIISSNNNIGRIRKIVAELCKRLGENRGGRYAFPMPQALAGQNTRFFEECGAGYRAAWIPAAARAVADGFDLEALDALPTPELCARLRAFNGVGPKVADCVALFAYKRLELFPVDTWVKKIYAGLFNESPPPAVMRERLLAHFGQYGGLAQQYLFYYYRSGKSSPAPAVP